MVIKHLWILLLIGIVSCTRTVVQTEAIVDRGRLPCGFPRQETFTVSVDSPLSSLENREILYKAEACVQNLGYALGGPTATYHLRLTLTQGVDKRTTYRVDRVSSFGVFEQLCRLLCNDECEETFTPVVVPEENLVYTAKLAASVSQGGVQIWQGKASTSDQQGDMRHQIDYLLVAALHHLGGSTTQPLTYRFKPKDRSVRHLQALAHQRF